MERLQSHPWPGNVRELEAVLARALLRARTGDITPVDLDLSPLGVEREPDAPTDACLERLMLESALREAGGNVARAAGRIGWTRQKLYRRMVALGVARPL
jgi:DNA-binding NtrC family response regulator